jgi:hypothetical protein
MSYKPRTGNRSKRARWKDRQERRRFAAYGSFDQLKDDVSLRMDRVSHANTTLTPRTAAVLTEYIGHHPERKDEIFRLYREKVR